MPFKIYTRKTRLSYIYAEYVRIGFCFPKSFRIFPARARSLKFTVKLANSHETQNTFETDQFDKWQKILHAHVT